MLRFVVVCQLILVSVLAGLGFAQSGGSVTLDAELSRSRAYVGDLVTYQVLVRGADDGSPPDVDFPPSVRAEYMGASSQKFTTMRSVNGRMRPYTDAYIKHQFQLMIVDEGDITIPGAALEVNGRRYLSNAARIVGLLPQYSARDIVEIEIPSRAFYVGESVVARVSWWIGDSQTSGANFNSSVFPESMRVTPTTPRGIGGEEHSISLMGQNIVSYLDRGVYQGIQMMRLRFDLVITPTEAGDFELGPVRVVFTRQDGSRTSRMYGESDVPLVSVIDVPTAGMPAGYRGMIGTFEVQSDASNTEVNVGDPIDVRVLIAGTEPMMGLEETLGTQSLAAKGFRVSPEGWKELERRRRGERLFTTTVRALNGSIEEIPAIEFPAFNPETGEFEVFASKPIPINVRAVRSVTLSDAVISSLPTDGGNEIERGSLERNPSVLWAHPDADEIRGSARSFSLARVATDPVWIGALSVLLGLPVVAWVCRRFVISGDPKKAAVRRAWRQASKLHSKGRDVEAIRVYAGAILEIEPESFTDADLRKLGISEELVERSSVVLSGEEGKHYGRGSGGGNDGTLLRAIRHDLRHRGRDREMSKTRGRATV